MSSQTVFLRAGLPEPKTERGADLKSAAIQLMGLPDDDPDQGWRVIATYPARSSIDQGYRSAHARAQRIRNGGVTYLNDLGRFNAVARFMGDGVVGLFARWAGKAGERWE